MSDLYDDLPYLKPYKPRPYFGSGQGLTRGRSPGVTRTKKTWLYIVTMERNNKGGGVVKLFLYNRSTPVATASFADKSEGEMIFEQVWEKAQEMTEDENERLRD